MRNKFSFYMELFGLMSQKVYLPSSIAVKNVGFFSPIFLTDTFNRLFFLYFNLPGHIIVQ